MTPLQISSFVFSAFLLMSIVKQAGADIVQCVDKAGAVTYTDVPCNADAETVSATRSVDVVRTRTQAPTKTHAFVVAEQARASAETNKIAINRRWPLDVTTLKAARIALASKDDASVLARQQASAQQRNYQ